jgi:2-oxoglutarate ferredoxin oxidoreductase subunit gamma
MRTERILVAGAGGQGIVFLGKLLANAALERVPHITFFPSYGAEVRGGDSHCQVTLSDGEISSPVADAFDVMIVMNQQGADRFLPRLVTHGIALVNSSLCKVRETPDRLRVPATEEADQLGDPRVANMVMLGALLARREVVSPAGVEANLKAFFSGSRAALDRNLAAFHAGMAFA